MSSLDKRGAKRRRTLLGGVLYGQGDQASDCRVTDMSSTGVRLKTSLISEAGKKLFLRISKLKGLHQCEVMWVRNGLIGLRFIKSIGVDILEFSKTFNFIDTLEDKISSKKARLARLRSTIMSKPAASSEPEGSASTQAIDTNLSQAAPA